VVEVAMTGSHGKGIGKTLAEVGVGVHMVVERISIGVGVTLIAVAETLVEEGVVTNMPQVGVE